MPIVVLFVSAVLSDSDLFPMSILNVSDKLQKLLLPKFYFRKEE